MTVEWVLRIRLATKRERRDREVEIEITNKFAILLSLFLNAKHNLAVYEREGEEAELRMRRPVAESRMRRATCGEREEKHGGGERKRRRDARANGVGVRAASDAEE
ncbi:hypothetical protein Syun_024826 [Stephania yunnanensis]|uniref:Uncharacterized protein n=1 Tax=Stephania yunnanensis TaxID=152371 RepID=A0AAP0EQY8_9MAGN